MILRYLLDRANAITAIGLAISLLGMYFAVTDRPYIAIIAGVWATFIDHLDGFVAQRTRDRSQETAMMGRHLDCLTDFAGSCILPSITFMQVSSYSATAVVIAIALTIVGALRMARSVAFVSHAPYFSGLPVFYTGPLLALVYILASSLAPAHIAAVLSVTILAIIALQLSSMRVPNIPQRLYFPASLLTVALSVALFA